MEEIYDLIGESIFEIKNVIFDNMLKATELDMNKIYLINCELNKIMTQKNKDLKNDLEIIFDKL